MNFFNILSILLIHFIFNTTHNLMDICDIYNYYSIIILDILCLCIYSREAHNPLYMIYILFYLDIYYNLVLLINNLYIQDAYLKMYTCYYQYNYNQHKQYRLDDIPHIYQLKNLVNILPYIYYIFSYLYISHNQTLNNYNLSIQ